MISLIIGNKGSGKTKRLIEMVNQAVEQSKGNVVCIEKGQKLTYDINYQARLVDTNVYGIKGYDSFYGFLCGICAGNYDVTHILVDATLKIGGRDYDHLTDFMDKISVLAEESNTKFVFTISCDESDLPPHLFEIVQKV